MSVRPSVHSRPLSGKRIVITRARDQASRFRHLLEEAGAEALEIPTIRIGPPDSWEPLDRAIAQLAEFKWVIFTSVNGVESFRQRSAAGPGDDAVRHALRTIRIAAIGPATAAALEAWGISADLVPAEYRAEGLVDRFRECIGSKDRVLLPRAARTRDVLPKELERLGARVTEAPAYRTLLAKEGAPTLLQALRAGTIDVVTFTSSSTVRNFVEMIPEVDCAELLGRVAVACIGPITAATASEVGLRTQIMPSEYTIPALTRAIIDYYVQKEGVA